MFIPILLGLALDELSMNALAIPMVKKLIRSVTMEDCTALTDEIFKFGTAQEIHHCVRQTLNEWFPKEFETFGSMTG